MGGAETRLVLARLLLVQGRPKEAEFEASEAYEAFQRGNVAHLAGAALALRAQALAELSRGGEARAALLASQPYAERSQYFEVQKRIGLSKCAVLLTLGRIDEARKVAAGVREGAEAVTAAGLALEASRWVAMCDLASGNAAEARRALITVAKEARRRGLLQIAREAEAGLLPKRG